MSSSAASDASLIDQVRAGDVDAYAVLYSRHRDSALCYARTLTNPIDAEDLVAEAFSRLLALLKQTDRRIDFFRGYLFKTIQTLSVDGFRTQDRITPTGNAADLELDAILHDPIEDGFNRAAARTALWSLPETWQMVLWHIEVEGMKPAAVADMLGATPAQVHALVYRAREGLRTAFLAEHAVGNDDPTCEAVRELLGGHVRGRLSRRDRRRVDEHLEDCYRCAAIAVELTDLNTSIAGVIAPVLLGGAALAYLKATSGHTAAALLLVKTAGRFLRNPGSASTTTATVAGATVATAAAAALITTVAFHASGPSRVSAVGIPHPAPSASVSPHTVARSTHHRRHHVAVIPAAPATPSPIASVLPTAGRTPTALGSRPTPTPTPTATASPSAPASSSTPTPAPTPTATATATAPPTPTPTPTATSTPPSSAMVLPDGTVGQPYSQLIQATGGVGPYTWILGSTAPAGLAVTPSTSVPDTTLAGVPTTAGTYTFSITVTDSTGASATGWFTITVN